MKRAENLVVEDTPVQLEVPEGQGKHQAIILIGQGPSTASELSREATLLSSLGHVSLTFPLLDPQAASTRIKSRIAAAITLLNDRSDVRHGSIAVWSFGARCGAIASTVPGISAAIILHLDGDAGPESDWQMAPPFDPRDVQCPVLLIFATSHPTADAEIERIRATLEASGKTVEVQRYEAPESNIEVTMESFPPGVIADRWEHVQAFLRQHAS